MLPAGAGLLPAGQALQQFSYNPFSLWMSRNGLVSEKPCQKKPQGGTAGSSVLKRFVCGFSFSKKTGTYLIPSARKSKVTCQDFFFILFSYP